MPTAPRQPAAWSAQALPAAEVFGWDIGGAHVKACRLVGGRVLDAWQWPCPLWQGMAHLAAVLAAARQRWPQMHTASHAATMTGEMVDLFTDREDGVTQIAAQLADALAPGRLQFFAGDAGWCGAADAPGLWRAIASANWLATARHAALAFGGDGVLVDIGSTTTDLIAWRGGRICTAARTDADRLASGELLYQGVVRTPLCALAQRIAWRGREFNVMNEWFASTADVHRLTGQLDPAHDLQACADNAGKDLPATRARLARMIGLDARDGSAHDWLQFARAWRACQLQQLGGQLRQVLEQHGLGPQTQVVSAGCGAFLVPAVAASAGLRRVQAYASAVATLARAAATDPAPPCLPGGGTLTDRVQVAAPSVAVAWLWQQEALRCGS